MAMDGFRLGLDWVDNTGTQGENPWEVGRRQGTVQTSGAGGFGRVVSEDFRNAVSSFSCLLLLRLTLFCGTNKQQGKDVRNRKIITVSSFSLMTNSCDGVHVP